MSVDPSNRIPAAIGYLEDTVYLIGAEQKKLFNPKRSALFVGLTFFLLPRGLTWLTTPPHRVNGQALSALDQLRIQCAHLEEKLRTLIGNDRWYVIRGFIDHTWITASIIVYFELRQDRALSLANFFELIGTCTFGGAGFLWITRCTAHTYLPRSFGPTRALAIFIKPRMGPGE